MKKWPLPKPTCLHVQFISPTLLIINLFHILYFAGSELFHFIQYLALDGNENRGFTSSEREEGGVSRESEKRFNLDSHRRNITHGWSSLFYLSLVGAERFSSCFAVEISRSLSKDFLFYRKWWLITDADSDTRADADPDFDAELMLLIILNMSRWPYGDASSYNRELHTSERTIWWYTVIML